MLNIKEKLSYTLPTPVEPAFEANEAAVAPNRKQIDKKTNIKEPKSQAETEPPQLVRVPTGSLPPLQISPSKQKNSNVRNRKYDIETNYINFEYVGEADTAPNSNVATNSNATVRYEIPENRLSRTATLILGNRKELEMHEFSTSRLAKNDIVGDDTSRHTTNIPDIDPTREVDKRLIE